MTSRTGWIVGIVALIAAFVLIGTRNGTRAGSSETPVKPSSATATTSGVEIAGLASCSARACHGGLEPQPGNGIRQNEYALWLAHDKHSQAFSALRSDRGARMARNLGIARADQDARCLSCHVTPQLAGDVGPAHVALREDGVGCESCHGPANGRKPWLNQHTLPTWTKGTEKVREELFAAYGMTPLFNLEVQAKTCAGCHVGAPPDPEHGIPARDMNHDLMAAGHPRLTFELGTFRANMPPHWRTNKYAGIPGYEAKVWAVGQVVSAQAALDLLKYRATSATAGTSPWPEFAEAGCYSCHADLHAPSWRRNAVYYKGREAGAIPYDRWYTMLLPALAGKMETDPAFASLAAEINRPLPNAKKIVDLSAQARTSLEPLLTRVQTTTYDRSAIQKTANALYERLNAIGLPDWDQMTQTALAAAALREANRDAITAELSKKIDEFLGELAFQPSYESPKDYSPEKKISPGKELRNRLLELLREMAH